MFVTTAGRTDQFMIGKAKKIALELQIPYINRSKRSIAAMQEELNTDCLVVGKERLEIYFSILIISEV